MKKLCIILAFFVVMMGFAVWEIISTVNFYKGTITRLGDLEESFAVYSEQLDAPENLAVLEELERYWFGGRNLVLMFGNHTVIRNADERMTALCEFTRQNELSDAMVSLRQAQRYVGDLMRDVYPSATNLL